MMHKTYNEVVTLKAAYETQGTTRALELRVYSRPDVYPETPIFL
jgi:hypothetical protein